MVSPKRNIALAHTNQFTRDWIIAEQKGVELVSLMSIDPYK